MENPVVYSPIDTGKILSDTATNFNKKCNCYWLE